MAFTQPTNWHRGVSNKRCLYCARRFGGAVIPEKEHLIARNFVPAGAMNGGKSWNFIFSACSECNRSKSQLEGHVAAVTQFRSEGVAEVSAYAERSQDKARGEFHPWTKRPVADSFHESTVSVQGGSIGVSMRFVGPPQLDRTHAYELALRHIQGFFALVTNVDHRTDELTLLDPSRVWVLGDYIRSDWGNSKLRAVHERTRHWKQHLHVVTASDFFRCVMRRESDDRWTWFWLLEWNRSTRVAGMISSNHEMPTVLDDLPRHRWLQVPAIGGAIARLRQEEPLDDADDDFFLNRDAEAVKGR